MLIEVGDQPLDPGIFSFMNQEPELTQAEATNGFCWRRLRAA